VPIMVLVMLMAARRDIMGDFAVTGSLRWIGWIATAIMALAAVGMFWPA
jgi:Mn2+/Fe2+ NRAMP family transporter